MADNFWQEFHYNPSAPGVQPGVPTDGVNPRAGTITVTEMFVAGDLTGDFTVVLRRANALVFALPLWVFAGTGHFKLPSPMQVLSGQSYGIFFMANQAGSVAKFKAGVAGTV